MQSDQITILATTCPRPSHPSTKIFDEAMASARESLPNAPILITCDGPRSDLNREQIAAYNGFCSSIEGRYDNAHVVRFPTRGHQTGNVAEVLSLITTPLIFFVEDDWLILSNIQWAELCDLVLSKQYNYIKLYPMPRVSPWHEGHMKQRVHHEINGQNVFMIQTTQFSANPHLASTAWYREMSQKFNFAGRQDFIEEAFHGIMGQAQWEEYRLGIYNPDAGDFMRCRHLDGKRPA